MSTETFTNSTYKIKATYSPPPSQKPLRPTTTVPMTGVEVRCDNAEKIQAKTPGCVNPQFAPTVTFSRSTTPDIVKNIENGQATLNGIGTPAGGPVHRVTQDERDANRCIACSTARTATLPPPRTGMVDPSCDEYPDPSCDEYPFASTLEGGSSTVIAWVPSTGNSSQRGDAKKLFRQNRIVYYLSVRDAYFVEVGR